jgi:hypothetical protein
METTDNSYLRKRTRRTSSFQEETKEMDRSNKKIKLSQSNSIPEKQQSLDEKTMKIVKNDIQTNQIINQTIQVDLEKQTKEISSWLVSSLRDLMTEENVRNKIMSKELKKIYDIKSFVFGKSYSYLEKKHQEEVEKYLSKLSKNKISIFTASNYVDPKIDPDLETHFQSFIYYPLQKKLYIIDPAIHFGTVYQREIANQVIIPYFIQNYGLNEKDDMIYVYNYCQLSTKDIYCQTWTLITLLQELFEQKGLQFIKTQTTKKKKRKGNLTISFRSTKTQKNPKGFLKNLSFYDKKRILKDFFVRILKDKSICKQFKEIYNESIQSEINKYPFLKIKNHCNRIKSLNINDF